jgi:hypothetical protein
MSVQPYWKDPGVVLTTPAFYQNLTGPHVFNLSNCASFQLHPCRLFLSAEWPDEQSEALRISFRQIGYHGYRFPCIGARISGQEIVLVKGHRRIRTLTDLSAENIPGCDQVVFYLSDQLAESEWLSLIFLESQHEDSLFNLQPFSSRREIPISTLHKLFWNNPNFSTEKFRLPSNNKSLTEKLKTICPDISERSLNFWKATRFFSSNLIESLQEKGFSLTKEILRKLVLTVIAPACSLSSTFRNIAGFNEMNL